jgi:hypothetical protein
LLYNILYCPSLPCAVLYCIALYCTVLHCTALYCTVLYCITLYCTALHSTALYYIVLYCTEMYCTDMYCTKLYISKFQNRIRNHFSPYTFLRKIRFLHLESFGDLAPYMWGTFRFYVTVFMFAFTFWLRLYVHYIVQYLYLQV